ncbi:Rho termination factor N-terminal domain-containing protein [Mollicutes bacterium LVI A0039]|nr:Rho termination factor N-terminal domain-containing protein [Mollicutes bacterium LVI A0039]
MNKKIILNFLTKDMHIQKDPIDLDILYDYVLTEVSNVRKIKLTPKNKEKIERKLRYLEDLDIDFAYDYHKIDEYSLLLLRSKYGLLPKLKNKMIFNNHVYRFIFEFYYYKHQISYDQFVEFDNDHEKLAEFLDINIDLILQKKTSTLEELSNQYNCTRESIRLRIIDAKKLITTRYPLPKIDYVLDSNFDELDYMDKIILLSYHDEIWQDKFKAYIVNPALLKKTEKFETEIKKLKSDYAYPIVKVEANIVELVTNYVENDNNLYMSNRQIFSLVKNGEHHNANYILNYLKTKELTDFYIEDLLHDDFLKTIHGTLMSASITTSLRNLEAILDREDVLVKVDTHQYKIQSSIKNIDYLDDEELLSKLSLAPDVVNLELLASLFTDEIKMLDLAPKGFYYLLKKKFYDKFKFRKLVIYNSDYKLQTKFEILAKDFDKQKVITLDDNLLPNATNLARKFKERGGLMYGDKLYNTNLLKLSKRLKAIEIEPDFDGVIYRSTFNQVIDDIVLDEIDFKRKFAFKLWTYLHDYEYFNFYTRFDSKYPELHTLVYAINDKQKQISYTKFIDTIEAISGSRKVYQILQNMIDSKIVDSIEDSTGKTIVFKTENITSGPLKVNPSRPNSLEVYNKLENIKLAELRQIAKGIHIKNINKYNKKELISILRNTVKIEEHY